MAEPKPAPAKKSAPPAKKPEPARRPTGLKTTGLPDDVVFYCKDCDKITKVSRVGRRYVYTCDVCQTKNVAFGTKKSIASFFHLEEEDMEEKTPEKTPETEKSS